MHFHYVAIISLWKRTWSLIWTKFNFFLNCHWNWLSAWFGRETYLNLSMYCAKFNWTKLNRQKGIRKVYLSFHVRWAKLHFWTTTHHYGNNLPGIAVIPCSDDDRWIVRGIIGSIIYDRTLHLKYQPAWLSIKTGVQIDGCKITQLQLISNRNKGFDCLDVNGFVRFCKKFQGMCFSHNLTQS